MQRFSRVKFFRAQLELWFDEEKKFLSTQTHTAWVEDVSYKKFTRRKWKSNRVKELTSRERRIFYIVCYEFLCNAYHFPWNWSHKSLRVTYRKSTPTTNDRRTLDWIKFSMFCVNVQKMLFSCFFTLWCSAGYSCFHSISHLCTEYSSTEKCYDEKWQLER